MGSAALTSLWYASNVCSAGGTVSHDERIDQAQHLGYEIAVLAACLRALSMANDPRVPFAEDLRCRTYEGCFESLLLHSRNVIEFFFPRGQLHPRGVYVKAFGS